MLIEEIKMAFKNMDMDKETKRDYLFVDDLVGTGEPIPEEILKSMSPTKGKVTSGTFNIKNFERIA